MTDNKPLDPSDNAADLLNDSTGMTGISDDHDKRGTTSQPVKPENMSEEAANRAFERGSDVDLNSSSIGVSQDTLEDEKKDGGNDVSDAIFSPAVDGEQDLGGTNQDPSVDDDVDQMMRKVGLSGDDPEHPQELDIASQIDKAEEDIREN